VVGDTGAVGVSMRGAGALTLASVVDAKVGVDAGTGGGWVCTGGGTSVLTGCSSV
jgi:hypothetical protein